MNTFRRIVSLVAVICLASCGSSPKNTPVLTGTWRSLFDKEDMSLQITFGENNQFKTVLERTGQVHTNLGWYDVKDDLFLLKDSIDLPLPVCNTADTGKYTFQLSNDTLRFTKVADACERRALALQVAKFVKVK